MSYVTFAVGVLYGFGLGVLLDQANLISVTSFSLLLVFLIVVPALVWLELRVHHRRVKNWARIQQGGRFMFVFGRYVLLRGGIITAVLMYALRARVPSGLIYEVTVPFLLLAIGYIGHQEWENCMRDSASLLANARVTGDEGD
jgi:hypothetical protein